MGVLRLALAIGVLLSHTGGSVLAYALTPGDASVQCFFIISGFLMTLILTEKYDRPQDVGLFYSNRFARIFSIYLVVLAAALIVAILRWQLASAGPLAAWKAAANRLTFGDWTYLLATHLALFGQDATLFLRMSPDGLQWTADFHPSFPRVYQLMLIPQAWSLSLELMFYLMAPFLVRRNPWLLGALIAASLALRRWAWGQGYDSDPWSYRFFPFELAMFLAGALSYRIYRWLKVRDIGRWLMPAALATLALVALFPWYDDRSFDFFSAPRLALYGGLTLGLPFLYLATYRLSLDRAIGDLSYPLYLTHELVASLVPLSLLGAPSIATLNGRTAIVLALSLVVSYALVRLVDAPLDAWRQARVKRAHRTPAI